MIDFSAPLAGLNRATESLEKTATRLAAAGDPSGDSVDLSAEMVALILARNLFEINAKVLHTQADAGKNLLDLLG